MGNSTSSQDPALKALRLMLKSRGLEISDSSAQQAWENILQVAPWISSANPFAFDTWARVEALARKKEKETGGVLPLGFYPIISALMATFAPGQMHAPWTLIPPQGET